MHMTSPSLLLEKGPVGPVPSVWIFLHVLFVFDPKEDLHARTFDLRGEQNSDFMVTRFPPGPVEKALESDMLDK